MLNLKVALLLLLVFASTITATAMAFSTPAPVTFHTSGGMVAINISVVEPLGDPIDDPRFPH